MTSHEGSRIRGCHRLLLPVDIVFARLRPFHDWLAKYEQAWNDRLDRVLDQQGTGSG